jgi:hypothetical protein
MAPHEPNVDDALHVVDLHDEAILVAADIEDSSAIFQDAGRAILFL